MSSAPCPALPLGSWDEIRDTLTLWLQLMGEIRITRPPLLNDCWNSPFYLTLSGLTTSIIPDGQGRNSSIDLDPV